MRPARSGLRAINTTIKRTAHWGKAFRTVAQGRETEVRERDFDHLLIKEEYVQLTSGQEARTLVEELKKVKPDHRQDVDLFVQARDYLMLRLILSCAQRPGAVANLTVKEYKAPETDPTTGYAITFTAKHKTSSMGPAPLAWDDELRQIGDIYFTILRPHFANSKSMFEGVPGCAQRGEGYFLSSNGRPLTSSQVSRRIDQMGKAFCPDLKGNLSGARIRKSAVSHHRLAAGGPKDKDIAKTMTHAVDTANKHYLLEDAVKNNAGIAYFLNNMMQESATHPPAPSSSTSHPKQRIGKVAAWLANTEDDPQQSQGTSGSMRKIWTDSDEQVLVHATRLLPRKENLPRQQIIDAVAADDVARAMMTENGGQFTQQQIRDKYKSICRKYKKK